MVVDGCLARDRDARPQDVSNVLKMLAPLLPAPTPSLSAPALGPGPTERGSATSLSSLAASAIGVSSRVRKKAPIWMLAATGAGVVVIATYLLHRQPALFPPAPGMARIPGASYSMGIEKAELDATCKTFAHGCPSEANNELPARPVTVASFDLDVREVTNEEFALFLRSIAPLISVLEDDDEARTPRFVRYHPNPGEDFLLYDLYPPLAGIEISLPTVYSSARPKFERLPVTLVTWLAAHLYCKSVGKRLPTESEWELAARGIAKRHYPWGNSPPTCAGVHIPSVKVLMVRDATFTLPDPGKCDNARTIPFPIMSAPQDVTPQGIFDMAGNVAEWVDDDGLARESSTSYASRAGADRPGILRGGAFSSSFQIRTTARNLWPANSVGDNIGFRCAKSTVARR
jgi:formylglycine-generating enzyme required for sulfatase activity